MDPQGSNHFNSLEVKILKDIDNQINSLRDPNSLIRQWFSQHKISNPSASNSAFKGVLMIGKSPSSRYNGPGVMVFPKQSNNNNNCYIGNFRDGKRDEKGWRLMKGYVYIGGYRTDKKHGRAQMIKAQTGDLIFNGTFVDDKMHGKCFWKDNTHTFDGNVDHQIYHGPCEIQYPSGDRFSGTMNNGKIEGNGSLQYSNGDVYVGQFNNNVMHGRGTYTWKDGGKYEGQFKNGKMSGGGEFVSPIGVVARGDLSNKNVPFMLN